MGSEFGATFKTKEQLFVLNHFICCVISSGAGMAALWAFTWGRTQRFPQQERLASGKEIRDPRTENSYSEFTKEYAKQEY